MAPRKQVTVSSDINDVRVEKAPAAPPLPASKLPPAIRFPLLCIISLSTSALLYTFMADLTGYELARTSRQVSEEWQTTAVVGVGAWRIVELGIAWFGGFDDLDVAALTIVTHFPYLYLIHTFFLVSANTTIASLAIDVLAISLPTYLLRPRSPTHATVTKHPVPNRRIIKDAPVVATTSLLGASIYTVVLFSALRAGLNSFLINNFDDVPSLAAAGTATLGNLVLLFLPVGWAVREFILDPSLGVEAQVTVKEVVDAETFDPATATLPETIEYNFWGWEKRTKVVIGRTLLLATVVLVNTAVQVYTRVRGAELGGAVGWGVVFAIPAYLVGSAFLVVGDV